MTEVNWLALGMTEKFTQEQLDKIVNEVIAQLNQFGVQRIIDSSDTLAAQYSIKGDDGIFENIQDALNAAEIAQKKLMTFSLEHRKEIIQSMRSAAIYNAERLGNLAVQETGLGRVEHKVQKVLLAARKTPGVEDLEPTARSGDNGLTLVEMAPYGVIGSITPCTNPPSTVINNGISMVAAGNSVVFNPHPVAKEVSNETVRILNRAIVNAGGPENLLCSTKDPTLESSKAIMTHPQVKLLCVTGGGAVVKAAMACGKKCIAAGPGNPPVIVDDTANIRKAAKNIMDGATFDNNVLCTAEKEVFVFNNVADYLKEEMKRYGAYEAEGHQITDLINVCFEESRGDHPKINKKWVGKDAHLILAAAGIHINRPDKIRLVILEADFDSPFVQAEQLMPILPIVRVSDINEALEKAKKAEHGFKHSAMMHSESLPNLSLVAKEIETTIFVKNGPSYAGLGFGGEGYTTLSIAGPTGEGLTSARTFTRQRRCVLVGAFRII